MEGRLSELNFNEILLYLGHKGQTLDSLLMSQIKSCIEEVKLVSSPRLVYRRIKKEDALFLLEGNEIKKLLEDSNEVIIMAATIGSKAEVLLRKREVTNITEALILDSAESVAIENVCNNAEEDFRKELKKEGLYLTDRFSPGYGDYPLKKQLDIASFLNLQFSIGVSVRKNYLMVPRKSVTAIMGVSLYPQSLRKKGCECCNMFMSCRFRKEGINCNG